MRSLSTTFKNEQKLLPYGCVPSDSSVSSATWQHGEGLHIQFLLLSLVLTPDKAFSSLWFEASELQV